MPELPEVEAARRILQKQCQGKRICKAWAADDNKVFDGVPAEEIVKFLEGKTLVDVGRKAKYFWLKLSDTTVSPVLHFGMSGSIAVKTKDGTVVTAKYARLPSDPDSPWPPKYCKMTINFDDGSMMAFSDPRRFGRIKLLDKPLSQAPLKDLGWDALDELPDKLKFIELIRQKYNKGRIKAVLLEQSGHSVRLRRLGQAFSAGVGNWVADEVLYHARVHPESTVAALDDAQLGAVHGALDIVIKHAVSVDADAERFPKDWLFHYRWTNKKKSSINGKHIEFVTVGSRTSAFVPELQKLARGSGSVKAKAPRKKQAAAEDEEEEEEQQEQEEQEEENEGSEEEPPKKKKKKATATTTRRGANSKAVDTASNAAGSTKTAAASSKRGKAAAGGAAGGAGGAGAGGRCGKKSTAAAQAESAEDAEEQQAASKQAAGSRRAASKRAAAVAAAAGADAGDATGTKTSKAGKQPSGGKKRRQAAAPEAQAPAVQQQQQEAEADDVSAAAPAPAGAEGPFDKYKKGTKRGKKAPAAAASSKAEGGSGSDAATAAATGKAAAESAAPAAVEQGEEQAVVVEAAELAQTAALQGRLVIGQAGGAPEGVCSKNTMQQDATATLPTSAATTTTTTAAAAAAAGGVGSKAARGASAKQNPDEAEPHETTAGSGGLPLVQAGGSTPADATAKDNVADHKQQ